MSRRPFLMKFSPSLRQGHVYLLYRCLVEMASRSSTAPFHCLPRPPSGATQQKSGGSQQEKTREKEITVIGKTSRSLLEARDYSPKREGQDGVL
jgi:hypothetical protein